MVQHCSYCTAIYDTMLHDTQCLLLTHTAVSIEYFRCTPFRAHHTGYILDINIRKVYMACNCCISTTTSSLARTTRGNTPLFAWLNMNRFWRESLQLCFGRMLLAGDDLILGEICGMCLAHLDRHWWSPYGPGKLLQLLVYTKLGGRGGLRVKAKIAEQMQWDGQGSPPRQSKKQPPS